MSKPIYDNAEFCEEFYQHFNSVQREIAWCYVLARHGRNCFHCGVSFEKLIADAEAKDQLAGTERKLPVLVIENNANTGIHCLPVDDNLVPSCYPCNRNKNLHDLSQAGTMEITRAKLDALKHEPIYHNNLKTLLLDDEHLCYNEMKYAGKELSDGMNEVTCMRYFNSQKRTKVNKKGIYWTFPYNCGSPDCNGVHVSIVGTTPLSILRQEVYDLRKTYNSEFMGGDLEKFKSHTATSHKTFIGFNEFYSQHTKLLKYFPEINLSQILPQK